jgi:hypothetical protein
MLAHGYRKSRGPGSGRRGVLSVRLPAVPLRPELCRHRPGREFRASVGPGEFPDFWGDDVTTCLPPSAPPALPVTWSNRCVTDGSEKRRCARACSSGAGAGVVVGVILPVAPRRCLAAAQRRAALAALIADLFTQHHGTYGSPRITADLRDFGWWVSKNTVARLMADQGLVARCKRRWLSLTRPVSAQGAGRAGAGLHPARAAKRALVRGPQRDPHR